jgi:hypothetical protein
VRISGLHRLASCLGAGMMSYKVRRLVFSIKDQRILSLRCVWDLSLYARRLDIIFNINRHH